GVAVGVSGGKVQRANVFAIEMNGHIALEGDDRERFFWLRLILRLDGAAVATRTAADEPLAHVIMSDDRGAAVLTRNVAASVVAVKMGVEDKADRLVGNA